MADLFYLAPTATVMWLVAGGAMFTKLWPGHNVGFLRGVYYTWCLMFMETPTDFREISMHAL